MAKCIIKNILGLSITQFRHVNNILNDIINLAAL